MTIKISRAQADTIRAIDRGLNTSPPLDKRVIDALINHGYAREVLEPHRHYQLTEEGQKFCR